MCCSSAGPDHQVPAAPFPIAFFDDLVTVPINQDCRIAESAKERVIHLHLLSSELAMMYLSSLQLVPGPSRGRYTEQSCQV